MGLIYRFTTFDDAYAFLLEAKGLPDIATATRRRQRGVHASVLLSWVGLEEGLDHAIKLWKKEGRLSETLPASLKLRLSAVVAALSLTSIDDPEFSALRKIRNELTHPRTMTNEPELAVEIAERTFEFCIATIRAVFPFQVDCQF